MRSAVVVGAGVGGLAVAGALTRTGWQVTLLERGNRLPRPVSSWYAALSFPPNFTSGACICWDISWRITI